MKQFILGLFFLLLSAIFYSTNVIAHAVANRETESAYLVIILSVISLVLGIFFLGVSAKNED